MRIKIQNQKVLFAEKRQMYKDLIILWTSNERVEKSRIVNNHSITKKEKRLQAKREHKYAGKYNAYGPTFLHT